MITTITKPEWKHHFEGNNLDEIDPRQNGLYAGKKGFIQKNEKESSWIYLAELRGLDRKISS